MLRFLLPLCALSLLAAPAADTFSDTALDAKIEALRKADFTVHFTENGKPLSGKVECEQLRHAFPFGTCVNTGLLTREPPDENSKKYQETLTKYFNFTV